MNPRQEYKFNYAQLNAEATFDIANCLGGFNHKRFFNPYLFAGIGVNMAFNNDDAVALNEAGNKLQYLWDDTKAFVAGRLGVGMNFRICDAVAFNLRGNANTLSDHFNSKKAGNADWQFNILAGVSTASARDIPGKHKRLPRLLSHPGTYRRKSRKRTRNRLSCLKKRQKNFSRYR